MPQTLQDQLGAFDNLNEPVPGWNRPATIVSTTLVFSVRPNESDMHVEELDI